MICTETESSAAHADTIAQEITEILQADALVRLIAARSAGREDGWRELVAPVWMRIVSSKENFATLEEGKRRCFLKRQVRWALRDLLAARSRDLGVAEDADEAEERHAVVLSDPSPVIDDQWALLEDRQQVGEAVREAWSLLPAFDRAILALYAGCRCEHDATIGLADRVGVGISELIARLREIPARTATRTSTSNRRGGSRGRQAALAQALGVTDDCLHQWTSRAKRRFRGELRGAGAENAAATGTVPMVLERLLA